MHVRPSTPVSALVAIALGSAPVAAQTPLDTNLLVNPGFENGLTGWLQIGAATAGTAQYDDPDLPTSVLSNLIGGNGSMLLDVGGDAVVEQTVPLTNLPQGSHLHAGGFFGGGVNDDSRLVVRFLNGSGVELDRQNFDYVNVVDRNFEDVLIKREARLVIPENTAEVALRIELRDNSGQLKRAAADEIFAIVRTGSMIPPAVPLGVDIVVNGSFEQGWTTASPLTPERSDGWEVEGPKSMAVEPYSDLDPNSLDTVISCLIGGGVPGFSCVSGGAGNYLGHNGDSSIRQRIDVRGNAGDFTPFGARALAVTAFLGGIGESPDSSGVQVVFRDENLTSIAPVPALGPVSSIERNEESVLVKRVDEYLIPPSTAFIDVEVEFFDFGPDNAELAMADLVEARVVLPSTPPQTVLGIDLLANGSFEAGSLPGSPLQLTDPDGWQGTVSSYCGVESYGSSAFVPDSAFATQNGLGGSLLRDTSKDGSMIQSIDLASLQTEIDLGQIEAYAQAWLGGFSTQTDEARVELRCVNAVGVQVGGAAGSRTLGPVSAADRNDETKLMLRTDTFAVPPGTAAIEVRILFDDQCCTGSHALADDVRLVLSSTDTGNPVLLPGSGEDLRLFTGINSPPTSGPGNEVELATAGDVLSVSVLSPLGTYDLGPLLLGATVYGPGPAQYPLLLPSVLLDTTNVVLLMDGLFCSGFGCPVVLPGGTVGNYLVPAGLAGLTIRLQALAFAPPGSGVVPANGAYASTEAHEVLVQ